MSIANGVCECVTSWFFISLKLSVGKEEMQNEKQRKKTIEIRFKQSKYKITVYVLQWRCCVIALVLGGHHANDQNNNYMSHNCKCVLMCNCVSLPLSVCFTCSQLNDTKRLMNISNRIIDCIKQRWAYKIIKISISWQCQNKQIV